ALPRAGHPLLAPHRLRLPVGRRRTTDDGPRTTDHGRRTTDDGPRTTTGMLPAVVCRPWSSEQAELLGRDGEHVVPLDDLLVDAEHPGPAEVHHHVPVRLPDDLADAVVGGGGAVVDELARPDDARARAAVERRHHREELEPV